MCCSLLRAPEGYENVVLPALPYKYVQHSPGGHAAPCVRKGFLRKWLCEILSREKDVAHSLYLCLRVCDRT